MTELRVVNMLYIYCSGNVYYNLKIKLSFKD